MNTIESFGASLSIKQCRNFKVSDQAVLRFALKELGLRRFRLMSYWNECETKQGAYDFTVLDKQLEIIGRYKGDVTLCLGARQPRWPESHWPEWAKKLPIGARNQVLLKFIETVVVRYKDQKTIVSWQLENEALLKNFGKHGDFDRTRLRTEYALVKHLDQTRPVIMTTSTSWGIPLRRPIPDIVGFSYYRITHDKGQYRKSIYQPWIFKFRALLIKLIWRRPSFIHELQAEPWGPKNIWEMPSTEQAKSMNAKLLQANITAAQSTKLLPIDLWGLEWWYWLAKHSPDPSIEKVLAALKKASKEA
ncbi:hypothetical protein EKI60_02405 [Candidatus Saccharibacteria bacterium]|nr:MAG: hypothetical protein EKI60_02405 [Candidatus Saccharibacteria bacterium]